MERTKEQVMFARCNFEHLFSSWCHNQTIVCLNDIVIATRITVKLHWDFSNGLLKWRSVWEFLVISNSSCRRFSLSRYQWRKPLKQAIWASFSGLMSPKVAFICHRQVQILFSVPKSETFGVDTIRFWFTAVSIDCFKESYLGLDGMTDFKTR